MTPLRRALTVLPLLLALVACKDDQPPAPGGITPEQALEIARLENEGIGLLERFEYVAAIEPLRAASDKAPEWVPGRVHLALALMNAQAENLKEAYEVLLGVLEDDPENARAAFLAGRLAENAGDEAKAYELYKIAYTQSGDSVAGAKLGTLLANSEMPGAEEEGREVLEAVHAADPTLVSPVNGLMLFYLRTGEEEKGMRMETLLRALKGRVNPAIDQSKVGVDVNDAYGNMGPLSMADRSYATPGAPLEVEGVDVATTDPVPLAAWTAGELTDGIVPMLGAAALDFDADGDIDLFLCGGSGPSALLRNDGGLAFTDVAPELGLDLKGVYAAAAGELDVDARPRSGKDPVVEIRVDLLLVRKDGLSLYLNDGKGGFKDATADSGLAADPGGARAVLLVDADQEGDVDIFLSGAEGQPNRLWANRGPGKFEEVGKAAGLAGDGKAYGPAVVVDVDEDRDLDLLVSRPDGPPTLFLNDRMLAFHVEPSGAPDGIRSPLGTISGDFDQDGYEDVLLFGDASTTLLRGNGVGFEPQAVPGAGGGVGVDVDCALAGRRDLVLSTGKRLQGALPAGPFAAPEDLFSAAPGANLFAADLDGAGAEELILLAPGKAPQVMRLTGEDSGNALVLDLQGVIRDDQQAGWSNLEGRGALVEVRAGRRWQQRRVGNPSGFGISGPARQVFGVAEEADADFVRTHWPDGVQHGVLDIPVGAPFRLVEEQLRPDSCPLIFSWNGERFVFVADFLGAGGLGFLLAPDVYGEPDPTETVLFEPGMLVPDEEGRLLIRLPEAMEETCYIDAATLQVVHHPAGTRVYPDERFAGEPPFPNGDLQLHAREILPASATNARGEDVLAAIADIDRVYHESRMTLHPRLLGATGDNVIEIDFGDRLAGIRADDKLYFCGNGWIEYGYTRTSVAAAGEGFEYVMPVLEAYVPGRAGGEHTGTWKPLVANLGFPAGFPRTMTYDVTGLISSETPRLRIRTNFEVYWDRIWLATQAVPEKPLRVFERSAETAELRWIGYPREFSPDGRHPRIYDYQTLDPDMPWKTVEGDYTRYGDVRELLRAADDRYVIYGKGEEIALAFDGSTLPPLPEGWVCTYLIRFTGWCKGQELYTAHGFTVGPLPFLGMSNYPYGETESYPDDAEHREYRERWNTRVIRRKPRRPRK